MKEMKEMKRLVMMLSVLLLMAGFVACSSDDNPVDNPPYSDLRTVLQETGLFYDISENPDTSIVNKKAELNYKEQYSMFFRQDTNHDDVGGDEFMQRVCILFRGFDRPTVLVTEGYNWRDFGDVSDLTANLNANMVCVEHRNFGKSYNQDKGQWKYQNAAQASADLHAVYQALKPLFKGKWMCAGTSKSGETAISYAYYYPQDMDLAASFCAPLAISLDDKRFGPYLMEKVGTEQSRSLMKALIRKALENGEDGYYRDVCQMMKSKGKEEPTFTKYVFNLFDLLFQEYQYTPSDDARIERMTSLLDDKEAMLTILCSCIIDNDDDEMYAYWVECAKEQGFQNNGYAYFADLLEGTSFDERQVLPSMLKEEDRWLAETYDSTVFTDIVNNFMLTSPCPLMLYYVHNDPWTAAMPPKLGPNAKLIMNPVGKHSSALNDPALCSPAVRQEVMDYVQKYIY